MQAKIKRSGCVCSKTLHRKIRLTMTIDEANDFIRELGKAIAGIGMMREGDTCVITINAELSDIEKGPPLPGTRHTIIDIPQP